jgi:hypothetical protein
MLHYMTILDCVNRLRETCGTCSSLNQYPVAEQSINHKTTSVPYSLWSRFQSAACWNFTIL